MAELGSLDAPRGHLRPGGVSLSRRPLTIVQEGRTKQYPSVRQTKQQLDNLHVEWRRAEGDRQDVPCPGTIDKPARVPEKVFVCKDADITELR